MIFHASLDSNLCQLWLGYRQKILLYVVLKTLLEHV